MQKCVLIASAFGLLSLSASAEGYIFSSISQPGATSTNGLGVNNAGVATGSSSYASPTVDSGWVWNGAHTNFRVNLGSGDLRTNYNGIADDGTTVGFYDSGTTRFGFSRTGAGVVTTLPLAPSSANTTPLDMNSAGAIVGTISPDISAATATAFLFQNGAYTVSNFAFNGSTRTQFNSINNAGQIVGRWRDGSNLFHGLIYNAATNTAVSYDLPGATQTHFFGVNDVGQIVGYYSSASFTGTRGFLLENALDADPANDAFIDVIYNGPSISGTTGSRAYSINDAGTIVGTYNGFSQAYIAIVPEPATLSLLVGAGTFALRRRR